MKQVAYYRYLKGKRVALVGPAGYLRHKGQEIDPHDIIVRLNNSFPLPKELHPHIGSRTDVLYHTCGRIKSVLRKVAGEGSWVKLLRREGIKVLVSKHHPTESTGKNKRKARRWQVMNKDTIKTLFLNRYFLELLQLELGGTDPNMGTLAITHLLNSELKELSIYGVDFGKSGYYPGYTLAPGFSWNEAHTRILRKSGKKKRKGPHDKQRQIKYLRELFSKDPRVNVDEQLWQVIEGGAETL